MHIVCVVSVVVLLRLLYVSTTGLYSIEKLVIVIITLYNHRVVFKSFVLLSQHLLVLFSSFVKGSEINARVTSSFYRFLRAVCNLCPLNSIQLISHPNVNFIRMICQYRLCAP